jgi:glycosyltransferase involved in cell wall biosynthesis
MKILYVSSPLKSNFGGGEKFIENLVTSLPQHQHSFLGGSLALYKLFEKLEMKAKLSSAGLEPVTVKNLVLSPLSFLSGLFHTIRFKTEFKQADVIVSPTSFTELFFVLPFVRIFWNKPMVFIIQNNRFPHSISKSPLLPILKWMWQKYPVVFMSKAQQTEWNLKEEIAPNGIVIHHGIQIYNEKVRGWTRRDEIVLGFLARIHQEKGLDTLFKSLAKIKSSRSIRLDIAGTGEYSKELLNLQQSLSFPKNIKINWLGFVSPTKEFINNLDLLIFPSRRESFGLVVVESWERGVPVLCSNLPVFLELKDYQKNIMEKKLIHSINDVESLKNQIELFLENINYWRKIEIKTEIRQTVLENFEIQKMAEKYQEIFKKATTPKPNGFTPK